MRRPTFLAALVAASIAASLPATASGAGDPIMPLGQVASGMRCTGLSVIRGTAISSFDVEVIDVISGEAGTDGPRILVEASGPAVAPTGIGPGFSGSPIYCPDAAGVRRHIGAISESIGDYGGRVVLATPIEAMLANPVDAPRPRGAAAAAWAPSVTARGDVSRRAQAAVRRMRALGTRDLAAALTVGGLSRPLGRALEAAGKRIGRPVISVPAGPLGDFPVQTLRPGSAVSVGLSSGDIRFGGVGTVAYVDGDQVWSYGHSYEGAGARSLLLQDAYVFRIVNEPNAALTGGSYKLAIAGHDVGTLTNDAFAAVVGRVGALPDTTPVKVIAQDADTGRRLVVETTIADETDIGTPTGFTPLGSVAPLAVAQAAGGVMRSAPGRLTGEMCVRMTFRERPRRPVRFCNRYLSSTVFDPSAGPLGNGVAFSAAVDLLDAVTLIEVFEGPTPRVTGVEANVEIGRGEQFAILRKVRVPRRVRAGQRVRVRVTLQRIRGRRFTRTYTVRIPEHLRPGRRTLGLRGTQPSSFDEALFEELLGDELGAQEETDAPARLHALLKSIERIGRWDGVRIRSAGETTRAFRDSRLVIGGRVRTTVRVVRR